jgi:pimeloyl-ACP methyl ester carboxylesterase
VIINISSGQVTLSYGNNPTAGGYATVNGIKMYYEIYGSGEPLVLIHGNGASISSFNNQIPFFSKYYKVIVADSRAQGKSGDNDQKLSYQLMASDWAALLDYLKIDSALICGWSDGGIIGLIMAMDYPKKVKKLAAMGANILPDTSAYQDYVLEFNRKALEYINKKIAEKDNKSDWQRNKKVMQIWTEISIPFSELHKIKAPTIIMVGDKDMVKEEHTINIYRNIEKSHLCIFPGASHAIPMEDPETFNQAVHRFFSKPYMRPDLKPLLESFSKDMSSFYGK